MKFTTRDLATIAVFGALWGIVEMSLGTLLKSMNVPLSGAVLATIGLAVALTGRVFVPKRGATLFTGVIAMLLKLFSLGGIIIGPIIGILAEALIAEIVLTLASKPNLVAFLVSGSLGVLWTLLQPLVTGPLLFGRGLLDAWKDVITKGSKLLGLDPNAVLIVALVLVMIHLALGGIGGWLGWNIGKQLYARLGRA
jgi:hypothetical protein